PQRYRHDPYLPFAELPRRLSRWDIGIAPLADIPFNLARSDIKLKEYAASELPWLASPVGPYAGHGEAQGGRLVPDDGWFEALNQEAAPHCQMACCDVIHVYRRGDDDTLRVLQETTRHGTVLTYDNDDDFTTVPKQSPLYEMTGGLKGQRVFAQMASLAKQAR